MLRVRSINTANLLAEQVPEVDVVHLTPMSGVTDTAAQGTGVDFTSRNDDIITTTKVALIKAADILELPQGQAYALLEGNRRFKIRIPLADSRDDPFVPESLRKVAGDMKQRYRTSEKWAKETDWLGDHPLGLGAAGLINTDLANQAAQQTAGDGDDGLSLDDPGDGNTSATPSLLPQGPVVTNLMVQGG